MRTAPLGILVALAFAAATTTAFAQTKPAATTAKPATAAKPAAGVAKPAAAPAAAAAQPTPMQLLESKNWRAVTAGVGKAKQCFAMTKPQKMDPPTLNHGDVFFFISTRPGENVRNEPSLQVGYPLKEGSKVAVDIDGKKFSLFTKGDGAWLENGADYAAFLDAMKKGKKMTAAGASGRGNPTNYVFALAGLTEALDAVAKECK